ncbi:hypothetical protein BCR37DRAFT_6276 [Protomyces lactucae-debilis]|uniref:NAD-dependent epimerase/dehydratase domain-containing protein n=1 Tax=Protomyces lactucae-debilis TaxID=2754530 RepID=A0A1Y2FUM8_PROLT|nr:uncharacterized protein BCR37DRAFT_6276 [Protomyces lactucae-debilis]ORY87708.1 hypothetical protein BCR37DRAFT_6276 [Protomyces lactucae-debilis]
MSDSIKIFFLGATGYLGGHVLDDLLDSKLAQENKLEFTLISRTSKKLEQLKEHLKKEHGSSLDKHTFVYHQLSHDQLADIKEIAAASDIVMNPADSDDLPLTSALNEGLKLNKQTSSALKRGRPLHIHVSGTALLCDGAHGEHGKQERFDDMDAKRVWDLPKEALHHEIDLEIRRAGREDDIDVAMILPPLIHGVGRGMKKLTRQGPALIASAYERKVPGMAGPGKNLWSYSHINDTSSAIVAVTEAAVKGEADVNDEGVYFTSDGKHDLRWVEYVRAIAKEIEKQKSGHLESLEPTAFTEQEEGQYLGRPDGANVFGGNSLSVGNRTAKLGWKFEQSIKEDVYQTLAEEVRLVLAEKE